MVQQKLTWFSHVSLRVFFANRRPRSSTEIRGSSTIPHVVKISGLAIFTMVKISGLARMSASLSVRHPDSRTTSNLPCPRSTPVSSLNSERHSLRSKLTSLLIRLLKPHRDSPFKLLQYYYYYSLAKTNIYNVGDSF